MFELHWTNEADAQYRELKDRAEKSLQSRKSKKKKKRSKDEGLFKQVQKTIKLLRENPRHRGLQTHEYESLPHPYRRAKRYSRLTHRIKLPGPTEYFGATVPRLREITIIAITPHP